MALKAVAALSLASSVGFSAEVNVPSISDLEIDGALGADDSCAATGDEGALCALQALQLKARKHDFAASESGETMGACDQGLIKQVKDFAPDCINACSASCPAMGTALNAYLTKGGQPAAKSAICDQKQDYYCFYQNWDKCKSLVSKAAGFGFTLPTSTGGLNAECSSHLLEMEAKEDTEAGEEEEEMGSACDQGLIKQVKDFAPDCINACSASCPAMGNALNAYLTKGGQPAAKSAICHQKHDYYCFYQNWDKCKSLVSKAASFGFTMPTSTGALNAECR